MWDRLYFFPGKPLSVGQFGFLNPQRGIIICFGVKSKHVGTTHTPGLITEITNIVNLQPDFLKDFTTEGVLQCFANFNIAGN